MTLSPDLHASPHPARDLWIALASLVLIAGWEASGWDLVVAHWYGGTAGFPWRDLWWTRDLLHDGGRRLSGLALALFALGAAWPTPHGPARRTRLFWFFVTVANLVLVPAFKRASLTSCPWDLMPFGGHVPYVPHWLLAHADGGPGHCFPSGHAVAALAFFSLYFLWRQHRPALAAMALVAVCVFGALFGWVQLVRGAHFPSHTMWSAWLCWTICAVAAWVSPRLASVRRETLSVDGAVRGGPAVGAGF